MVHFVNGGYLMIERAIARALCGACLFAYASSAAFAAEVDERNVLAIPAIASEAYAVNFDEKEGYLVTAKKGQKFYTQSFAFDLMQKEGVSCVVKADHDIFYQFARAEPDRVKGARPGWNEKGMFKIKGDGKPRPCGFAGTVKDAGKYDVTFLSATPGAMRVYFFNDAQGYDKALAETELTAARSVSAQEFSALPLMAKGKPTFMAPLPKDGEAWLESKPEALRPFYSALLRDSEYNAVGNFAKLGVAAMSVGEYKTAEWALDQSLDRIEAIYANDDAAKAARSKFSSESIKDFKGDPYERAMAYYYRGLLYLRDGDYGNARASFATAEYQDTISEAEEYQSDFGLMSYLTGWSAHCMGNETSSRDAFAAAEKLDKSLAAPAAGEKTLVIAEAGGGPVKIERGKAMQMVGVVRSYDFTRPGASAPVLVSAKQPLVPAADISYQATTRGGRKFDAVMNGKVSFQDTMETVSDIAGIGASVLSDQLGAFGGLLSIGTGLLAKATKTNADVRYWDSLPDTVYLGTTKAAPAKTIVAYHEGTDAKVRMTSKVGTTCNLVWVSDRNPALAAPGLAGSPANAAEKRASKDGALARDESFRKDLIAGTI